MEVAAACWMCSVLLLFLLGVPFSVYGALDLHLSDTLQAGAVVANLSLGAGWTYALDRTRGSSRWRIIGDLVRVNARSGELSLAGALECSSRAEASHVPLNFVMKSVSSEDLVRTRLNLFVHGRGCLVKPRTRSSEPDLHVQFIHKVGHSCLSSGVLLLYLEDYVPAFARHANTFISSSLSSPHWCTAKNFSVYVSNGSLYAGQDFCLSAGESRTETVLCRLGDVSMHIRLWFITPDPYSLQQHTSHKWRRRRGVNSAPVFQLPNFQVSVPENEPAGTHVITLKATDADSGEAGRIEYGIEALFDRRSSDFFRIDPETGSIETQRPLDREFKDTHVFKVTATDSGTPRRSATSYLTVTVSDTNDHGPVFEQIEYRVSIRENVEVGFEVMTVRATDEDAPSNANMIYKIVNGEGVNSVFEIDSRNGLVKVRVRPDRETLTQYLLIVEANDQGKDPGPRSATATVHITVEDENDNYPQFSEKRYIVQVPV